MRWLFLLFAVINGNCNYDTTPKRQLWIGQWQKQGELEDCIRSQQGQIRKNLGVWIPFTHTVASFLRRANTIPNALSPHQQSQWS